MDDRIDGTKNSPSHTKPLGMGHETAGRDGGTYTPQSNAPGASTEAALPVVLPAGAPPPGVLTGVPTAGAGAAAGSDATPGRPWDVALCAGESGRRGSLEGVAGGSTVSQARSHDSAAARRSVPPTVRYVKACL